MLHTWIIWESTQESHTFYTLIILESWIGITCFKTLTCGCCSHVEGTLIWLPFSSCVATIQLPCGYHTGALLCYYHTTCMATMQLLCGYMQLLGGYQILCGYHTTPMWLPYNFHVVHHNLWIDPCMLITVYGSCTLITVYGSHIWIPHIFHTGFSTHFHICFPHITHVNHLGIYTGILYISHMNHIGILDRNHMFQDTDTWKLLTCGGDINLAAMQLLCGYHTTPCGYHTGALLCYYHTTCMAIMQLLCGSMQLLGGYQILCGYHTTPMWCTIICE